MAPIEQECYILVPPGLPDPGPGSVEREVRVSPESAVGESGHAGTIRENMGSEPLRESDHSAEWAASQRPLRCAQGEPGRGDWGGTFADRFLSRTGPRQTARRLCLRWDTAVRVLSHAGIDPDYIVTVDPQPVNRVFLEGYRGKARIVLDPTVSHHTAKYAARNPVHVTATPFQLGRLFAAMLGEEPGEISFGWICVD
jgi:hypothetical protein